jgi:hypothetical protein
MKPYKAAILEDDPYYLRELQEVLSSFSFINIVHAEQDALIFIEKVRSQPVDFLFLDIELSGQAMNGLRVGDICKLPVMFISSNRQQHYGELDSFRFKNRVPADNIGKMFDSESLSPILKEFCERVDAWKSKHKIVIKPKGDYEMEINPDEVCWIETVKGTENKKLYFVNREPVEVAKISINQLREKGFSEEIFIQCGKSALFSKKHCTVVGHDVQAIYREGGIQKQWAERIPSDKYRTVLQAFR